MDFLKRAQDYCEHLKDDNWFAHFYTHYREFYNVEDSVFLALSWMYGYDVANKLKGN